MHPLTRRHGAIHVGLDQNTRCRFSVKSATSSKGCNSIALRFQVLPSVAGIDAKIVVTDAPTTNTVASYSGWPSRNDSPSEASGSQASYDGPLKRTFLDQECVTYSRSLFIHNPLLNRREPLGRCLFPASAVPGLSCLAIPRPWTTPSFISPFIQHHLDDQAPAFLVTTPYPSRLFREHKPSRQLCPQVLLLVTVWATANHLPGRGTIPLSTSMIERRWHWLQTKGAPRRKYL